MMWGDSPSSRIIAAAVVLFGVVGVVVGTGGLYLTLTASDEPPDEPPDRGVEVLGEYGCEPADRDVRHVPNASRVEQTVTNGDRIESVNTSEPAAGARLNLSVEGLVINESVSRFDDGPDDRPNVTGDGEAVTVTDPLRAPFRLWIDAVDEDGTVVRTELDVCPPGEPA
jgi:hypothetical protein